MKIKLAWRLARLVLHLVQGLATCALVFPWARDALRERLIRRWSARLLGICRVRGDGMNLGSIIETLNRDGAQSVMVQKFLPEIVEGDKRILIIDGKPVPYCLARIPQGNEVRGNLAAGGKGVARALTPRDREIAEALGPILAARGLLLVGLDVIGDKVTEINVTSPTCFQEITEQTGFDVPAMFADALEAAP